MDLVSGFVARDRRRAGARRRFRLVRRRVARRPRYDAAVIARRPFVLSCALILVVACGSTTSPSPSASAGPTDGPSITPVPGAPSRPPASNLPSTTNTEFGRIWDELPTSFPKLPAQAPTDLGSATSGTFVVNGNASALATRMRGLLEQQGWAVDVGSPLEDGSIVLEAAGTAEGCKSEVRFTPASGTVVVAVLLAAACPFN